MNYEDDVFAPILEDSKPSNKESATPETAKETVTETVEKAANKETNQEPKTEATLATDEEKRAKLIKALEGDVEYESYPEDVKTFIQQLVAEANFYNEEDFELIEHYISYVFNPPSIIYSEKVPEKVLCNIFCIEASKEIPYLTLVTHGVGARTQKVPEHLKTLISERYEYAMQLPADFNLGAIGSEEDKYGFDPIKVLKMVARASFLDNLFMYNGRVLNDDKGLLTGKTKFVAAFTDSPIDFYNSRVIDIPAELSSGETVKILSVSFLYPEEVDYIQEHGYDNFLAQIDVEVMKKYPLTVINFDRPSFISQK